MLYDCWLRVAHASPNLIAVCDLREGRSWTFSQLADEAEGLRIDKREEPVVFAEGSSAEFILTVLKAWRSGSVLYPLEPGQERPELKEALPPDVVHLKMTSATTGASRSVAFTAAQLLADADNITQSMGLRAEWPNLAVISLAHSYGFSNLVLPLLLHGIPLILLGSALPEAVRAAAANESAVTLAAVPALWQTWHEAGTIPANTALAISAGAPLSLSLEQAVFSKCGLKIHNFYGSTECGGIAFDSTEVPRSDAALAGAPLENVQVTTADDGCLEVRGAAVGSTYWPEPAPNLGQSVFRTSDLGEVLGGLIFLRGRASDQINVAGRKVPPEAIERALLANPDVRACLAFGVPSNDTQRGETIVACIVGGAKLKPQSLKQFALAKLPSWQVPREWWFVDSLQANGRGKLSRAAWRERFLAHNLKAR